MKKYCFSLLMTSSIIAGHAQNVGIGTTTPFTKLHVKDSIDHRVTTYFENYSPEGNGSIITLTSTNGTRFQDWHLGSGIYGIGQNKFGIGDSLVRFVIDNAFGNVGIGTINPITRLSNFTTNMIGSDGIGVSGPSFTWGMNTQGYVQSLFNADPVSGGNGLAVKIAGNTSTNRLLDLSVGASALGVGTPVMIVRGDGRVGIGTGAPYSRLSNFTTNVLGSDGIGVSGNSLTWGMNAQGYVQSLFNAANPVFGGNGLAVKIAGNTSGNRLLDLSVGSSAVDAGTPVMIVRGDGKVGIGTNNPGARLSLGVSWPNQRLFSLFDDYAGNNAYGMGIEPSPGNTGSRLMIYSGTVNQTDAVTLGSYAGTTYNEGMRVQVNGLVGIGTTDPATRLHIVGNGFNNQLRMDDASGATIRFNAYFNTVTGIYPYIGTTTNHVFSIVTNNAYRVFVEEDGDVGIGTTTPSSRLHVNGTITATAPLNVVSDIRYKKNIMPLKNAVNIVRQLKGVSYELRGNEFPEMNFPSASQIGFIAQEVEKVLPGIVATDKTGNKSVSYTSVIPLLVEAVKEQQQQIDALKQLVEDLLQSKNKK